MCSFVKADAEGHLSWHKGNELDSLQVRFELNYINFLLLQAQIRLLVLPQGAK